MFKSMFKIPAGITFLVDQAHWSKENKRYTKNLLLQVKNSSVKKLQVRTRKNITEEDMLNLQWKIILRSGW